MTLSSVESRFGVIPTLWHGDGIRKAWEVGKRLLIEEQPRMVQLHTWDLHDPLDNLRLALPNTALVAGFGIDGVAKRVATAGWTVDQGISTLVTLYRRAAELGFMAVVWNAEAAWKTPPSTEQRARIGSLLNGLWDRLSDEPGPLHWHTAYDHPASHSSYPWELWLGAKSPVTMSFAQVYAGAGESVLAHRGKLEAREVGSLKSWAEAIRKGWVDALNCDWAPYYQLHHVPWQDTIRQACMQHTPVCLWAIPSRYDTEGEKAFRGLVRIDKLGGLKAWQAQRGLLTDGIFGRLSADRLFPGA